MEICARQELRQDSDSEYMKESYIETNCKEAIEMQENSIENAGKLEEKCLENSGKSQENNVLPSVRISVRDLVEFILRSGDIDNRFGSGTDVNTMLLGGKLHRKIQSHMGANYHAEVSLKEEFYRGDMVIVLEGRADGIIIEKQGVIIDEIKGIWQDLKYLKEPVQVHFAQAMCYAYIYACQHHLNEIAVQMTYCNLDTEEIKRFQSSYQFKDLETWFEELISEYEKWARFQIEWKKKRNASIKEVEFPFPYRTGQKKLVASVYRTIEQGKKLFIQAPTGVGKTIATIYPAMKAVGEDQAEKIFYLTAKTITRTAAWNAFEQLREQHLRLKVLILTAKEKMCLCDEMDCNPENCPYAKGHFDRVNDAVYELLMSTDEMNRETLLEQAKQWNVCPYEMSLDVSTWSDVIICDYNYVFDPKVRLCRFFGEGRKGDYLFLVDEAHNLVERAREMYSTSLLKEEILKVRRIVKGKEPGLSRKLDTVNREMLNLKRRCVEDYEVLEDISALYLKVLNLLSEFENYYERERKRKRRQSRRKKEKAELENLQAVLPLLSENQLAEVTDVANSTNDGSENIDEESVKNSKDKFTKEEQKELLNLYFGVKRFAEVYEELDDHYMIYSHQREDGEFLIRLFCVNPAQCLQNCLDQGKSAVYFSATLLPINYYKRLLSTVKDDYAVYAESPFNREKRKLLLGNDVSSKYTRRGTEMYQAYAKYIYKVAKAKEGNYMAFFPSYKFMEEVYEEFEKLDGDKIRTLIQTQNMSEEERENFLASFETVDSSMIGFCVMGGIFSEGIDLVNDRLIGAVIVGTGLPQVCRERELLKEYFEENDVSGFDYAYLYPGMNKVMQSAGRVIRTDEDEGVILLLDERFMQRRVKETFPREWDNLEYCTLNNVEKKLEAFWKTHTKMEGNI